jgi:hypothetical protein
MHRLHGGQDRNAFKYLQHPQVLIARDNQIRLC